VAVPVLTFEHHLWSGHTLTSELHPWYTYKNLLWRLR